MAPKCPIAVAPAAASAIVPLTEDEHKKLVIAIHLDAALHYYKLSGDSVDMAWFLQAIRDELGDVEVIYNPTCASELAMHDLTPLLLRVSADNMWWLPVLPVPTPPHAAPHPPVFTPAPAPTSTPMENPIPASTPVPAPTPRPAPTPTAVLPTATCTSACCAAESSAECAPTTPEAEDSDSDKEMDGGKTLCSDDPVPQRACIKDPKVCGPCKDANKTCRPQRGCKTALACRECTRLKVICDPLAGWAEVLLAKQKANVKPKRWTLVDMYEDIPPMLDNIKTDIQNDIAQLCTDVQWGLQEIVNLCTEFCHDIAQLHDHVYNQDKMLRLLCSQSNDNLSTAGLHIPSTPTFYQSASATPSTASIASTMLSTSSNLGISDLTIASTRGSPIAGPSHLRERLPQEGDVRPFDQRLSLWQAAIPCTEHCWLQAKFMQSEDIA
ncbi:hypothetical protein EI94DRAFT_1708007 [Lactarius quietus]|nr:hypothetical protein EI94DRAFT_1708007 [Lactarius quietus]